METGGNDNIYVFVGVMEARKTIGAKIAALRKAQGLTQKELAEKSELDRTYIVRVESGSINIGVEILAKIADALDTEIELVKAPQ